MKNNSKVRHAEILAAAHKAIKDAGGVEAIEGLDVNELRPALYKIATRVISQTDCTRDMARRNIKKAIGEVKFGVQPDRRGGWYGGGRPKLPDGQKRIPVSTQFAPGSKELAFAIAEIKGLGGWGRTLEMAMIKWVHADNDLRAKLAEMGIIVKANDGKGL